MSSVAADAAASAIAAADIVSVEISSGSSSCSRVAGGSLCRRARIVRFFLGSLVNLVGGKLRGSRRRISTHDDEFTHEFDFCVFPFSYLKFSNYIIYYFS